ncbi:MAG: ATP-binding protein, partial [Bacteroidota bacterium]
LYQASLEVDTALLCLLARADILGRICADQDELLYRIDLFEAFCQEQNCLGKARSFPSSAGRYVYFHKEDAAPDYVPYEKEAFEVILLSALPGSGKDTLIRKQYKDYPVVSIDELRRKHRVSPRDKKQNGRMVQLAKEQARVYLRKKQPFVWNATNITRNMRKQLIDLFQTYGARTKLIYLEVPYRQLLQQNRHRPHPVPDKALHRMIARLEVPALWEAPEVVYLTYDAPNETINRR